MEITDDDAERAADGAGTAAATPGADDVQLGEHAPALLSTEHWSLLAARSLIWSEAQSRATVFLTVLSAATIAIALLADATGFGAETVTVALAVLPVVLLLGVAAYVRLVQINAEEFQLVLAMNRLRRAYLDLEPGLERYLSTGHHDDQRGVFTTYLVARPSRRALWLHFLVNTPNIVATVDAALAGAVVALGLHAAAAPRGAAAAGAVTAFLLVWAALYLLQRETLRPFSEGVPRFPSPPDRP